MCKDLKDKYVELIQQNEGIIYKVINLHIDNAEDKKDVFQEILLQAWKSFPKFEERSSFSTWLYRVSLNTVFTFRKTTNKKVETSVELLPDIKSIELNEKPHELLYLLIKQLDKVDRTIMTLHLDAYKNKEIAEILGINVNHINVKIHRLKNQIIESYKKSTHG